MEPAGEPAKEAPAERRTRIEAALQERRRKAEEAKREIESRTVTVITTAMALVAALFWQTAITDTIKTFIPVSGAWTYELLVALLITVFAALAIYVLNNWVSRKAK